MFGGVTNTYRKLREFHRKYDRWIFPISLLGGFIVDELTFSSIDLFTSAILLLLHFFILIVCIYFVHFFDGREVQSRFVKGTIGFLPIIIQYMYGGLFGAFLIFFLKSAPFGWSMIFVLIIVGILIGSEIFRKYFLRLDVQMAMFFMSVYLFLFFMLSVLLGRVGTVPFLLSSIASVVILLLFLRVLRRVISKKFQELKYSMWGSVVGIFVALNVLFFFGLVPPIPLVLKDVGVYQYVAKGNNGEYVAYEEKNTGNWLSRFIYGYDKNIDNVPGTPVYVYSAIYAPGRVSAKIYHVWQYYNKDLSAWQTRGRIPFSISGGREKGYRGYTEKIALAPGEWRVNIETAGGELIGRVSFEVHDVPQKPPLKEVRL